MLGKTQEMESQRIEEEKTEGERKEEGNLQINLTASGLLIPNSFMVSEGSIISTIRVAIVRVVMMAKTHPGGQSFIFRVVVC